MTRFLDRIGSRVLAPFSSARHGAQSGSLAAIVAWGRLAIALGALPFVDSLAIRLAAALQPLYATPLPRWTLGAATAAETRILYGGSMNPSNAEEILSIEE